MNIAWKYIDIRSASIAALQDYENMKYIVHNTDENIKTLYEDLSSPHSPRMEGRIKNKNPRKGEDRLVDGLDQIDICYERYEQAKEYMEWFQPAWEHLSENDKYILTKFYLEEREYGDSIAEEIADHFHIERASAYRRKNRAIDRLTTLLYGK